MELNKNMSWDDLGMNRVFPDSRQIIRHRVEWGADKPQDHAYFKKDDGTQLRAPFLHMDKDGKVLSKAAVKEAVPLEPWMIEIQAQSALRSAQKEQNVHLYIVTNASNGVAICWFTKPMELADAPFQPPPPSRMDQFLGYPSPS